MHTSKASMDKLVWGQQSLGRFDSKATGAKLKIDPWYRGYTFGQSKEKLEAQVLTTHAQTDKHNPGPGHYSPKHSAAHIALTKEFTIQPKRSETSIFAVNSEVLSRPGPGTYDFQVGSFHNTAALKQLRDKQVRSATKFVRSNLSQPDVHALSGDTLPSVAFQGSSERFHDPIFEEKSRIPGPGDYAIKTSLMGANQDLPPGCECAQ